LDEILPTSNDDDVELSLEEALTNERSNSAMVSKRVTELGGIPKMLPITDSKNPPDERSMLLCLTYLCSRLMESSEEIFATILIQACYRRYREKVVQERKKAAAWVIYQFWCENKHNYYAARERRYAAAVVVLENFVEFHRHGLLRLKRQRLERKRQNFVATEIQVSTSDFPGSANAFPSNASHPIFVCLIQRCFRGFLGRECFFSLLERELAAIIVQKYFRRFTAHLDLLEAMLERDSAITIQTTWRSHQHQRSWSTLLLSVVNIQKAGRGFMVRDELRRRHCAATIIQKAWWSWVEFADSQVAAILIQSRWRGIMGRNYLQYLVVQHSAATTLQKIWRGYCQAVVFDINRELTISIQRVARGYLARKNLPIHLLSRMAIVVQKTWRGFMAQVQFNMDLMDIISIQSLARLRMAGKVARRRIRAIGCLQGAMRCALSRLALLRLRLEREYRFRQNNAAIVCQVSDKISDKEVCTFLLSTDLHC
jgi:hypothetical protein